MRTRPFSVWHGCTSWVLAAWLCVVLGSVASPWVRAQAGMDEVLCSASGPVLQVPSPAEQLLGAPPAVHALDCPLCLPLLAPPLAWQLPLREAAPMAQLVVLPAPHPWSYRAAAALPARGPPMSAHS
ncbi:MAG: hypothetical protein LBE51_03960 [Acidovorax sp.]|jgi:hypothetical protein|nr:hypothetical protein [Acidovorax sp.]